MEKDNKKFLFPNENSGIRFYKKIAVLCFIASLSFVFCGCGSLTPVKKAPNCEAKATKEQLIEIFKQNSSTYKALDKSTISSIEVYLPLAESYDKDIDKYSCTAEIYMQSTPDGFQMNDGSYYSGIFNKKYYKSYKTERITYSSRLSEGEHIVLSSTRYEEFSRNYFKK